MKVLRKFMIKRDMEVVFDPSELCNVNLIIDVDSLSEVLRNIADVDCVYGGDYTKFYEILIGFFARLKSADISPVVIVDGRLDSDDDVKRLFWRRKHEKQLRRCKKVVDCIKQQGNTVKRKKLKLTFCMTALLQAAKNTGVQIIHSFSDTDSLIAFKSNQLKCPVLSNYSGFYLYDLKYGLIPTFSLFSDKSALRAFVDGSGSIQCKVYFARNMQRRYKGVEVDVLPLFRVLLADDYVKLVDLRNFFDSLPLPESWIVARVLRFMCFKSRKDVIDIVLSFFKLEDREKVHDNILRCLRLYDEKWPVISSFGDFSIHGQKTGVVEKLKNLPAWLIENYKNSKISPTTLGIIINREVFWHSLVEDPNSKSMFVNCQPIFTAIYNVVLAFYKSKFGDGEHCIIEWKSENYLQCRKEICFDDNFSVDLPNLSDMDEIALIERQRIFHKIIGLGYKDMENFPTTLHLYFLSMRYWTCTRCEESGITPGHMTILDALIISAYFQMNLTNDVNVADLWNSTESLSRNDSDASKFLKHYINLNSFPIGEVPHVENFQTIVELNRFQEILFAFSELNSILDLPFESLLMENFYSGTIVRATVFILKDADDFSAGLRKMGRLTESCSFVGKMIEFRDSVLQFIGLKVHI